MAPEPVEDDDYFFGLDFIEKHNIRYNAWDMGVYEYPHGPRRLWAARIERRDAAGKMYDWAWITTTKPDATAPDWDDEIALKVRDAADGRLSFDAYITENLGDDARTSLNRNEYRMWVDATATWFEARDFLGWDAALIKSFFTVVPNEI
ncbi:hypothetical protein SAMN05421837_107387 [Amycolatopsis pretoriensis]|uniref:Uncharacterized protein n=1 Tax=Amycolatopsis pretoriensis TaxID=218821 RepID=A0A1H5R8N4_9PSEU|nr:hypothetical protein [Amycolatopsis pretoriensis]SEF34434.1 hypothetical protein SAMN05421837_107387 [Amycolatopsis pretoriensis]